MTKLKKAGNVFPALVSLFVCAAFIMTPYAQAAETEATQASTEALSA